MSVSILVVVMAGLACLLLGCAAGCLLRPFLPKKQATIPQPKSTQPPQPLTAVSIINSTSQSSKNKSNSKPHSAQQTHASSIPTHSSSQGGVATTRSKSSAGPADDQAAARQQQQQQQQHPRDHRETSNESVSGGEEPPSGSSTSQREVAAQSLQSSGSAQGLVQSNQHIRSLSQLGVKGAARSMLQNLTTSASRAARSTVAERGTAESQLAASEKREVLRAQLQSIAGTPILEGELHVLEGPQNTLEGGQSIVQMAEDKARNAFAMKFFLSNVGFQHEKRLYLDESQPMGQMLPRLSGILEHGGLTDAGGRAMPPCIIMERGESLNAWLKAAGDLDRVGCLQVMVHVSERLRDLHNAGFVHRDVKPGNIMFLVRRKVWTLIDFGSATRAGTDTPLSFTLNYVAPEVLKEFVDGGDSAVMRVCPAVDAWALGIVALELFLGKPLFEQDGVQPVEHVVSQILGVTKAPWEDRRTAPTLLNALGSVKSVVLSLLQRNPKQRLSMPEAFVALNRILVQSSKTRQGVPQGKGEALQEEYVARVAERIGDKLKCQGEASF